MVVLLEADVAVTCHRGTRSLGVTCHRGTRSPGLTCLMTSLSHVPVLSSASCEDAVLLECCGRSIDTHHR